MNAEERIRGIANDLLHAAGLPLVAECGVSAPAPALPSPLPLADLAAAFQLAMLHASALVGGPPLPTQARLDLVQALAGLEPTHFQRIHAHRFAQSSHGTELKSGFYATADGRWFLPSGSYPHLRDATLEWLDCANSRDAIGRAIQGQHAHALEAAARQRGLPGTYVRTPREWLDSEAGHYEQAAPLLTLQRLEEPAHDPRTMTPAPGDCMSLKVLDLSHVIAGPLVARQFALWGSDVLRVSAPQQPDPLAQILDTGIAKRNAFADFSQRHDLKRIRTLAAQADIVVDSWRTGAMARWELDATSLSQGRHKPLVYVSVSAFSVGGPWASVKGFDQVVQAATGIAALHATSGKPQLSPTRLLTDYLTGQLGTIGALGARYQQMRQGGSWHVKVSLGRVATYLLSLADPAHRGTFDFDQLRPRMVTRQGPFGITQHVATALENTPAEYIATNGPQPLGSSPLAWMPA